jgi:hypothetical protein
MDSAESAGGDQIGSTVSYDMIMIPITHFANRILVPVTSEKTYISKSMESIRWSTTRSAILFSMVTYGCQIHWVIDEAELSNLRLYKEIS